MRISAGSRGLSRNGGNIHVHSEIPFITIQPRIKRPISQSIPLAPLEIRDAVFRELIRISPASNYREELVTGPSGLLSRGLLEQHTTSYGALPPTNERRAILAGMLNDYVRANFPEHAESHSAVLEELGFGEFDGLLGAIIEAFISSGIEAAVPLFNKHEVFAK